MILSRAVFVNEGSVVMKDRYDDYIEWMKKTGKYSEKTINNHKLYVFGSLSHSIELVELSKLNLADIDEAIAAGGKHGKSGARRTALVIRNYLKFLKRIGEEVPIRPTA